MNSYLVDVLKKWKSFLPHLHLLRFLSLFKKKIFIVFYFFFLIPDNMGYKCNQSSSTLKNDVTNKSILNPLNSSATYCGGEINYIKDNSKIENILWYLKSKFNSNDNKSLSSSSSATDYEISSTADNSCQGRQNVGRSKDDEASPTTTAQSSSTPSLAYREHQRTQNIRTTTTRAQSTHTTATSSSNLSHSHYLVRQSICLYAASSVILALCYLTTPASASTDAAPHPV